MIDSIKDELRKAVDRLLVENSQLRKDRAALLSVVREYVRANRSFGGASVLACELIDALPEALRKEVTGG